MTELGPFSQSSDELWRAAVVATTGLLKAVRFSEFFENAAARLADLLEADGAALIVYDGPKHLKYRLFYGLQTVNEEEAASFRFSADQGTVGQVLATGKPLFTRDYASSSHAMPEFVAAGLKANLVLPLPGPNGFLGALAISWLSRRPPEVQGPAVSILEMFAALIGFTLYREQLEIQLENLSLQDPLTGLPNRRMLMVRLAEAQKRSYRHQSLLVLAVLDLDGFKRLNDVFGHAEGDRMLVETTARLQESVRATDMVARLGGDEFVVILEDVSSMREARHILSRVVEKLRSTVERNGITVEIRSSIGATVYPLDLVDPETLLHHADQAMYLAKRAGGNRIVFSTANNDAL